MGYWDEIPERPNGGTAIADWWNIFRTKLIGYFGAGGIGETSFTLPNNQSSATDVTGLSFSISSVRSAIVTYEVSRKTDTALSELRSIGRLFLAYRAQSSAWEILNQQENGDDSGVTFTVTAGGQVQVATTNIAGSNYVGTLKFKGESFNV